MLAEVGLDDDGEAADMQQNGASRGSARDAAVRRGRRLGAGIVAAGVLGALGLTGAAAAQTFTTRHDSAESRSQQPATSVPGEHGDEDDDGGGSQEGVQPQFQVPALPQQASGSGSHAQSAGS
jgi:hypothetical protein